jgi:NAD(P)-dependent dehydrogenase (short-subunit alcohol dehydrogenase family)
MGPRHLAIPCDVNKLEDIRKAVADVQAVFTTIDSIIFMSAIYAPGPVLSVPLDDVRRVFETNIIAAFSLAHVILPVLRRQGRGQFALCASVAGYRGLPNGQPYAATKAAVISLAETLRIEESPHGIDIRVINPGFVDTPMTAKNKFKMPMLQTPQTAAAAIADGLAGRSFEIHFPKAFTFFMKTLRLLPDALYFRIMKKYV